MNFSNNRYVIFLLLNLFLLFSQNLKAQELNTNEIKSLHNIITTYLSEQRQLSKVKLNSEMTYFVFETDSVGKIMDVYPINVLKDKGPVYTALTGITTAAFAQYTFPNCRKKVVSMPVITGKEFENRKVALSMTTQRWQVTTSPIIFNTQKKQNNKRSSANNIQDSLSTRIKTYDLSDGQMFGLSFSVATFISDNAKSPTDYRGVELVLYIFEIDSAGKVKSVHAEAREKNKGMICPILNTLPVAYFKFDVFPNHHNSIIIQPYLCSYPDSYDKYLTEFVKMQPVFKSFIVSEIGDYTLLMPRDYVKRPPGDYGCYSGIRPVITPKKAPECDTKTLQY